MNDTELDAHVKKYGPVKTLEQLLFRTGLNQYTQHTWFAGAELKPPYLFVDGDRTTVEYLAKRWGAEMARHIPGLGIRPKLKTERPAPTTKFPAIKPGRYRDLLDDEDR